MERNFELATKPLVLGCTLAFLLAACAQAAGRESVEKNVVSGLGTEFYSQDFNEGAPWGRVTGESCERAYEDGHLVVTNVSEGGTCELNLWLVGPLAPRVRIELTAGFVSGSENADFGLKFGYKPLPDAGFYTFTVKADGVYAIARYDGIGQWESLTGWRPDPFVYGGQERENHLALEIRGRELRYFANGAQLGSIELEHPPEGYVGLYLDAPGLSVRFDDFRVVNLPVAETE